MIVFADWLIIHLTSRSCCRWLFLLVFFLLRLFQAPLWHAHSPPSAQKAAESNKNSQVKLAKNTDSLSSTEFIVLARMLLAGQKFGSLSCCLYFLEFLSSGLWHIKVLWQHYKMWISEVTHNILCAYVYWEVILAVQGRRLRLELQSYSLF